MRDRLKRAQEFIGGVDALERFHRWKTPSERLNGEVDDSDEED